MPLHFLLLLHAALHQLRRAAADNLKWISVASSVVLLALGGTYGVLADYAGRRLPWALFFLSSALGVLPNVLVTFPFFRDYFFATLLTGSMLAALSGGYSAGLLAQFAVGGPAIPPCLPSPHPVRHLPARVVADVCHGATRPPPTPPPTPHPTHTHNLLPALPPVRECAPPLPSPEHRSRGRCGCL